MKQFYLKKKRRSKKSNKISVFLFTHCNFIVFSDLNARELSVLCTHLKKMEKKATRTNMCTFVHMGIANIYIYTTITIQVRRNSFVKILFLFFRHVNNYRVILPFFPSFFCSFIQLFCTWFSMTLIPGFVLFFSVLCTA